MKKLRRGVSLSMAMIMVLILFLLSIVSLNTMRNNASVRGNMYAKTVSHNASTSGVHRVSPELIDDAKNNFMNILVPGYEFRPDQDIAYTLNTFASTFDVTIEDNDDLDGNFAVDTDKRVIINSTGMMISDPIVIGQTQLRVLSRYTGAADEYAQATGTSKGNSSFLSEINIGDSMNVDAVANPNQ